MPVSIQPQVAQAQNARSVFINLFFFTLFKQGSAKRVILLHNNRVCIAERDSPFSVNEVEVADLG